MKVRRSILLYSSSWSWPPQILQHRSSQPGLPEEKVNRQLLNTFKSSSVSYLYVEILNISMLESCSPCMKPNQPYIHVLPVWWCAHHLRTASLLIHPLSSSSLLPGQKKRVVDREVEKNNERKCGSRENCFTDYACRLWPCKLPSISPFIFSTVLCVLYILSLVVQKNCASSV